MKNHDINSIGKFQIQRVNIPVIKNTNFVNSENINELDSSAGKLEIRDYTTLKARLIFNEGFIYDEDNNLILDGDNNPIKDNHLWYCDTDEDVLSQESWKRISSEEYASVYDMMQAEFENDPTLEKQYIMNPRRVYEAIIYYLRKGKNDLQYYMADFTYAGSTDGKITWVDNKLRIQHSLNVKNVVVTFITDEDQIISGTYPVTLANNIDDNENPSVTCYVEFDHAFERPSTNEAPKKWRAIIGYSVSALSRIKYTDEIPFNFNNDDIDQRVKWYNINGYFYMVINHGLNLINLSISIRTHNNQIINDTTTYPTYLGNENGENLSDYVTIKFSPTDESLFPDDDFWYIKIGEVLCGTSEQEIGDMVKRVYDPSGINDDAFFMKNFKEYSVYASDLRSKDENGIINDGRGALIMSSTERQNVKDNTLMRHDHTNKQLLDNLSVNQNGAFQANSKNIPNLESTGPIKYNNTDELTIKDNSIKYDYLNQDVKDRFTGYLKTGTLIYYTGDNIPVGYIKADGTLLKRDMYPELFNHAEESGMIVSDELWLQSQLNKSEAIFPFYQTSNSSGRWNISLTTPAQQTKYLDASMLTKSINDVNVFEFDSIFNNYNFNQPNNDRYDNNEVQNRIATILYVDKNEQGKKIYSYSISPNEIYPQYTPRTWSVFGGYKNLSGQIEWILLDERTNYDSWGHTKYAYEKVFSCNGNYNKTIKFNQIRFVMKCTNVISSSNSISALHLRYIKFDETDSISSNYQGMYSYGDGSTTFRVPKYDDQFLRISGRKPGSYQEDSIRNITGTGFNFQIVNQQGTVLDDQFTGAFNLIKSNGGSNLQKTSTGDQFVNWTFDSSRVVPVSDENRPKNISVPAYIKAYEHLETDSVNDYISGELTKLAEPQNLSQPLTYSNLNSLRNDIKTNNNLKWSWDTSKSTYNLNYPQFSFIRKTSLLNATINNQYGDSCIIDTNIYSSPRNTRFVSVYNTTNGIISEIGNYRLFINNVEITNASQINTLTPFTNVPDKYFGIISNGDYVYCFPYSAKNILKIKIKNLGTDDRPMVYVIDLPTTSKVTTESLNIGQKFGCAFKEGNMIYCLPYNFYDTDGNGNILKFNVLNDTAVYVSMPYDENNKRYMTLNGYINSSQQEIIGRIDYQKQKKWLYAVKSSNGKYYSCMYNSNVFMELNTTNDTITYFCPENKNSTANNIWTNINQTTGDLINSPFIFTRFNVVESYVDQYSVTHDEYIYFLPTNSSWYGKFNLSQWERNKQNSLILNKTQNCLTEYSHDISAIDSNYIYQTSIPNKVYFYKSLNGTLVNYVDPSYKTATDVLQSIKLTSLPEHGCLMYELDTLNDLLKFTLNEQSGQDKFYHFTDSVNMPYTIIGTDDKLRSHRCLFIQQGSDILMYQTGTGKSSNFVSYKYLRISKDILWSSEYYNGRQYNKFVIEHNLNLTDDEISLLKCSVYLKCSSAYDKGYMTGDNVETFSNFYGTVNLPIIPQITKNTIEFALSDSSSFIKVFGNNYQTKNFDNISITSRNLYGFKNYYTADNFKIVLKITNY